MKKTILHAHSVAATLAGAAALVIASTIGLDAKSLGWQADTLATTLAKNNTLPPLPKDTAELRFDDLFKKPVGKYELEHTTRLRELSGKRVRILGFMVRQEHPAKDLLLLAPYAMTTNEAEYGLCDDLPPDTIFVHVPASRFIRKDGQPQAAPFASPLFAETGHEHCHSGHDGEHARKNAIPWTPGPLLLTGTLETGRREEADGRVSHVRLIIAPDAPADDALRVAPAKPISTPSPQARDGHAHGTEKTNNK